MRDEQIIMRVSKEEKELLQKYAENTGIPLSVWIRSEVLKIVKAGGK